jgi:hypothetical protein
MAFIDLLSEIVVAVAANTTCHPNICDVKYPIRSTPVSIQEEEHIVSTKNPYCISLKEKPSTDHAVLISGYTEVSSSPTTALNFYVDYEQSKIYFYYTKAGKKMSVNYYGMGSPIAADDLNRFTFFLRDLKPVLFSFKVEALSGSRVRINGGNFIL